MENLMDDFMVNVSMLELLRFHQFCLEKTERSSVDEKLQLVYEYLKSVNEWPAVGECASKSVVQAKELRLAGNSAFQRGNYSDAVKFYTESVAVAPPGSQELAFAYANRSAASFSLQKYHECLLDINRAFQENYPEAGKQKLIDRKKKCLLHVQEVLNLCKSVPSGFVNHPSLKYLEELSKTFDSESLDLPPRFSLPKVDFKNKMIPNVSEKIIMKKKRDDKISMIANVNIKPGEVLAIQKPISWNLSMEFAHTHCANCLTRTDALIPCPKCSVVMFCSLRCREQAFKLFHRIECQMFGKLTMDERNGLLEDWCNIRTLLVLTKQGEELDKIMNHPAYKFPLAKTVSHNLKEKFDSLSLSSVLCHGRLTNDEKDLTDLSFGFNLSKFRLALMCVAVLKQTTFFDQQSKEDRNFDGPLTNRELYVATLLFKLTQSTYQCIEEWMNENDLGLKYSPIGYGLFPLVNIFSHSCDPHVNVYSYENNLVFRSIRPIKAGEEIYICHFRPYYRRPRFERILNLRQKHNFECTCRPCQRDWPVFTKLPLSLPKVISNTIGAKKFQEYSSRLSKLWDRFDRRELAETETYKFLCEYLTILEKRFEKPCREFVLCQMLLDLNMKMNGNFYNVIGK